MQIKKIKIMMFFAPCPAAPAQREKEKNTEQVSYKKEVNELTTAENDMTYGPTVQNPPRR